MSKSFLDILRDRIVVFDGAMGTNLHAQDLSVDDYGGPQFEGCPEHLLISMPEAVEKVHAGFLEVGCDVVETDSFGSTSIVLAEYQIAELAYELNVKAAQLAIEAFGTTLMGTEVGVALTALEPYPIDVIGMNCATGLQEMADNVRCLCQNWSRAVSVIPNAGIPENVGGHAVFKEAPESLAKELQHFARDLGVNIVGGCCGTTPAHLKAVVEAVKDLPPLKREVQRTAASSSIFIQQPYRQDTSFLIG